MSMELRNLADHIKRRLWICSPFVGGWVAVQKLLGLSWCRDVTVDVRLLTDIENPGALNPFTVKEFESHGQIKHLRGLHAKLFIVDDIALVTSANLTATAFSKRYETGLLLDKQESFHVVKLFNDWWNHPRTTIPPDDWIKKLRQAHRKNRKNEEPFGSALATINPLPASPIVGGRINFSGFSAFVSCYAELAKIYEQSGSRVWPSLPLYLETDAFLNFLFHDARGCPSKRFANQPARNLSASQRAGEIKKYKKSFVHWIRTDPRAKRYRRDRTSTWRTVVRLLNKRRIDHITRDDVATIVRRFHSMKAVDINPARFLKADNNNLTTIKRLWKNVLYPGQTPLEAAMRQCADGLYGFGKSNVQELLGWNSARQYPIRNSNSNAGLRFFGYKVSK